MSEIANNALKKRFGLEHETSKQRDLRVLLQEAREEERLYSLPFKLDELEVENIGKFEELSLDFGDGLNVIYGPNGAGKTTVIEAIVNAVTPEKEVDEYFIKDDRNSGSATLELGQDSIERQFAPNSKYDEEGVLLLDTPFIQITEDKIPSLVKQLRERFSSQIILTTVSREPVDHADNVIQLRSFTEERKMELEDSIEELEKEIMEKKDRLTALISEIEDLEMRLEGVQESRYEMESLEENREEIEESIERLEVEIDQVKAKLDSVENELDEAESEKEEGRLEERREHLENTLGMKREQLEEYKNQLGEIEDSMENAEDVSQEARELRSKLEHKRDVKHDLEDELENLYDELKQLEDEREELEEKMEVRG
jgi:exonuclease SbcC